jgi:hypothetical protein
MLGLNPIDGDVIIIGSDSASEKRAGFAAKSAALKQSRIMRSIRISFEFKII